MSDELLYNSLVNNEEYKVFRETLQKAHHQHTGFSIQWRKGPYVVEERESTEGGAGSLLPHPFLSEQPVGITSEDPAQVPEPTENEEAKEKANELTYALSHKLDLKQRFTHSLSVPTLKR